MHTRKEFRQRARVLRTLGNESRLFILDELGKEELAFTELARRLPLRVQNVSKHVQRMLVVDLVEGVRAGKSVRLRLTKRGRWWRKLIASLQKE